MIVSDLLPKPSHREQDLICIFNTIALFLEHQNFSKTSAAFREECESRGFDTIQSQHLIGKLNSSIEVQPEVVSAVARESDVAQNSSDTSEAVTSPGDNKNQTQVTYLFENGECEDRCDTASTGTTAEILQGIRSRVSVVDYLHLKEKFLDLQYKHRKLMDELDEKTRYLDQIIPILERNSFDQHEPVDLGATQTVNTLTTPEDEDMEKEVTCQKLTDDQSTACHKYESSTSENLGSQVGAQNIDGTGFKDVKQDASEQTGNSRPQSCSKQRIPRLLPNANKTTIPLSPKAKTSPRLENKLAQKASIETIASTVSTSTVTKSSDFSILGNNVAETRERINEVNFLFTRKKSKQVQSAPSDQSRGWSNGEHRRTKMCFSMPLSPRKHLPHNKYFPLDFTKLKQELAFGESEQRLLLLQALRWRLTRCSNIERSHIIDSYVNNDLLDIHVERNILDLLLDETYEEVLVEGVSRLLNVIASLKQGRDYLCSSRRVLKENIISELRQQLDKCEGSSTSLEMLTVTLQKLSIRKKQRKSMIQENLLQIVSNILTTRREKLSTYCLEYSCALFMNLCLEEEAKSKCAEDPLPIIQVFSCLLEDVQALYMPYIGGALYSILSEEYVRQEALKQKIDVKIIQQIQNTQDDYLRKQLEFIIRSRFRGESANFTSNENEPLEEVDLLEPELDENDTVVGQLQGEELLEKYKLKDERIVTGVTSEKQITPKYTDVGAGNDNFPSIVASLSHGTATTPIGARPSCSSKKNDHFEDQIRRRSFSWE